MVTGAQQAVRPTFGRAQWIWAGVVLLGALGLFARAWNDDGVPSRSRCQTLFAQKADRSQGDEPYWDSLADCAVHGLLPAGWNDPAYFQK